MRNRLKYLFTTLGVITYLLTSCSTEESGPNQLTAQEKEDGWQLLFDGNSLEGWHLYNQGKVPSAWIAQNGELYCQPIFDTTAHGDLVSDQVFENYELAFEWKISEGGNSGVFVNVLEREDLPTTWASGPEYQLLDKAHPDYDMSPAKRPGTLFNFYPPINEVEPKPAEAWNQSRIKQVDGKAEFYLNGVLTAQEDFNSDRWKEAVTNSNFKTFPEFSKHTEGRIALQDWSKGISFRNLKIKKL